MNVTQRDAADKTLTPVTPQVIHEIRNWIGSGRVRTVGGCGYVRDLADPEPGVAWGKSDAHMTEQTVFRTAKLPEGQDFVWHPDLNLVELSDRLDLDGRLQALTDLQKWWRREHLSVVETA